MICEHTVLLRESLTCGTVCHHVVNSCSVNSFKSNKINVGVVKMFIMTMILPELETAVTVTNSLQYSDSWCLSSFLPEYMIL